MESIAESEHCIEEYEKEFKLIQNKTQSLGSSSGSLEKRRKILHQRNHYSRQSIERREEASALKILLTAVKIN